jgi:hypothetical protein
MISLLHPSRGRPEKAQATALEWIERAGVYVDYLMSIDNNDPFYREYFKIELGDRRGYILHSDNNSVVDATNRAAAKVQGDILLYLSDDFKCFDNWGIAVENEFRKYSGPTLIKVDDCLQKFTVPVLTIPIMNRELYNELGYFWHPGYKSMFVDEQLYWRAKKLNALQFAPHIKFEHQHVSVGKAENDETYKRSAANWEQGKALFARHKKAGFVE